MKKLIVGVVSAALSVSAFADVPPLPPMASAPSAPGVAPASAQLLTPLKHVRGTAFDLRFVTVAQVVDLIYRDAITEPYVLSPDVLSDTRLVSFRLDDRRGDVRGVVDDFLDSLGYTVTVKNGVDYVGKKQADATPLDRKTYVYVPQYRSAAYLAGLLSPIFSGRVSVSQRPTQTASAALGASSAAMSSSAPVATDAVPSAPINAGSGSGAEVSAGDDLVFVGPARDLKDVKALLPQLDTQAGEVTIRGWAYEVDDTGNTNSGFQIASKLLGMGLSVSSGGTSTDANALQFAAGRLSFAISALNADSRFKQVSAPNVRCVSGQTVRLNVGQEVPTVSSVSYQGTSGTPVQSIDYQAAGVIFQVQPTVMHDTIQLSVDEEISSFESTTTGVSGSPTKNTRSLNTMADLKDGEVIVLGGLIQDQDSDSHSHEKWFPHFLDGRSSSKARTEVVLVLQVQKI